MIADEQYMQRAIQLALLGGVAAAPNPMVGAVIVHNDRIIGEGYHQRYGGPHAEVNAVNSVEQPELLSEATIYVSLEPCAHFGKTPPCADLLVAKRFKRVVIGTIDPFAQVAGQGIAKLEAAGIPYTVGVLQDECRELNKRFFTFHQQQRPYVILKWAQTEDGYIDAPREGSETGTIRWITSPETQTLVHQWRTREQAILVGWKTVLNDNPSLTVREFTGNNPLRVVIDSTLQAPSTAKLFTDGFPTLVLNTVKTETSDAVDYLQLPAISAASVLQALYERQVLSVIIEGGRHTLQQFIDSGLWDEAQVFVGANRFNGGTKAPVLAQVPTRTTRFSTDRLYEFRNA